MQVRYGWALSGTLQSVAYLHPQSTWQYQSTYQITFAVTISGAWGEDVQISNVAGTNLSQRDNSGNLEWLFTFHRYDAQNTKDSYNILQRTSTASLHPSDSGVVYYNYNTTLHWGSPLSQLTMDVVPFRTSLASRRWPTGVSRNQEKIQEIERRCV